MVAMTLGHVLLIRTDHLGDMLLTLPMAAALRAADPTCRITVLASAANAEAARHDANVDRVEIDPHEAAGSGLRGLGSLVRHISALRCDTVVVAHPTPRLALAIWLARVRIRVGTAYRGYSFLFNRRVHEHRRYGVQRHESEYNMSLLAPLGVTDLKPRPFAWCVTQEETANSERILAAHGIAAERLVAIHPGSAGSSLNWPAARYAELGRRLATMGLRVIVTGSRAEASLVRAVVDGIGPGAVDLCGACTLGELAAVYRRCALYVGGSTGPTHLAAAVGTPVIGLYSPLRSAAPQRWRPLGEHVRIFQPQVDLVCRTCLGERCQYFHCMNRHLDMDRVCTAAEEVLHHSGTAAVSLTRAEHG